MTLTFARSLTATLAFAWVIPAAAIGQQPVTRSQTTRATATIQAIDTTRRAITLKTEKGEEDTFRVSPDMVRFNELKVGDKINFTYIESLVFAVRKPGSTESTATTGDAAVTRGTGARPAATFGEQMKTTVTVKAIDPSVPSITVLTQDGRTVTRKIEDKKNLEGVKVGDQVDITYTESLMVSVSDSK
jgi:Cu/Ag efflux protein CusF